ncbi:hypothetical protein BH18ACT7_BH18ACT7_16880 [soil metagenome]|jgi:hypothetical protein
MERAYAGTIDEDLGDNDDGAVEIADSRVSGARADGAENPEGHVCAAVTDGNTPSERLLARVGFGG